MDLWLFWRHKNLHSHFGTFDPISFRLMCISIATKNGCIWSMFRLRERKKWITLFRPLYSMGFSCTLSELDKLSWTWAVNGSLATCECPTPFLFAYSIGKCVCVWALLFTQQTYTLRMRWRSDTPFSICFCLSYSYDGICHFKWLWLAAFLLSKMHNYYGWDMCMYFAFSTVSTVNTDAHTHHRLTTNWRRINTDVCTRDAHNRRKIAYDTVN